MNPFEEVPPPPETPIQPEADALGLAPGLRVERSRSMGRCGQCREWQFENSLTVWVPDQLRMGDPVEAVTEICRQNAYNGQFSSWCLECALKLSGKKAAPCKKTAISIWQTIKRRTNR